MDELKRLYEKLQKEKGVPNHRIRDDVKGSAREYKRAIIEMFKLQGAEREGLNKSNIRLMTENLKLQRTKVQQIHQLGDDMESVRKTEEDEAEWGINQFSSKELDNHIAITDNIEHLRKLAQVRIQRTENQMSLYRVKHITADSLDAEGKYSKNTYDKIFIPCEMDITEDGWVETHGGICPYHDNHKRRPYAVSSCGFIRKIIKKQKRTEYENVKLQNINNNNTKREQSLRDLNKKLIQSQCEAKKATRNQIEKLNRTIDKLNRTIKEVEHKYDTFKHNFIERIQSQIDDTENRLLDANVLIETYTEHKNNIEILNDYQALDQFIELSCYDLTGHRRNYYSNPPIFNNIYTFVRLEGTAEIVDNLFDMTLRQFKAIFKTLKQKRIDIAHPTTEFDIVDICNAVDKYNKYNS